MSKNQPENNRGVVFVAPFDEKTGDVVLVMDPSKPIPLYWKFPGGWIEEGDVNLEHPDDNQLAADNAAIRETEKKTGLKVQVMRLGIMSRKTHIVYLYIGLANFDQLVKEGEEGEIPNSFSIEGIRTLKNLMPGLRAILQMAIEKIRV